MNSNLQHTEFGTDAYRELHPLSKYATLDGGMMVDELVVAEAIGLMLDGVTAEYRAYLDNQNARRWVINDIVRRTNEAEAQRVYDVSSWATWCAEWANVQVRTCPMARTRAAEKAVDRAEEDRRFAAAAMEPLLFSWGRRFAKKVWPRLFIEPHDVRERLRRRELEHEAALSIFIRYEKLRFFTAIAMFRERRRNAANAVEIVA